MKPVSSGPSCGFPIKTATDSTLKPATGNAVDVSLHLCRERGNDGQLTRERTVATGSNVSLAAHGWPTVVGPDEPETASL